MEQNSKYFIAKIKVYIFTSNMLSLGAFLLLAKCLYSLKLKNDVNLINAIVLAFTLVSIFSVSFNFLLMSKNLQTYLKVVQFFYYVKELPLAFISFYYFNMISYMRSVSSFNYYFLLTLAVYFSCTAILNCSLIDDIVLNCFTMLKIQNILFLFAFRIFHFLFKSIGFVLFLVSYNDDDQAANDQFFYRVLIFLLFILLIFLFNFLTYWFFVLSHEQVPFFGKLTSTSFESFKMLIDFNHKFFEMKFTKFNTFLNIFALVAYFSYQVVVQIALSYFWYFKSIYLLNTSKTRTTLYNLLINVDDRLSLVSLFELQEKLKCRELELITIAGSIIISLLSYHIYYTYYFTYNDVDVNKANVKEKQIRYNTTSLQRPEKAMFNELSSVNIDNIDGFSIESYKQSSSIASSSSHCSNLSIYSNNRMAFKSSKSPENLSTISETNLAFGGANSSFTSVDANMLNDFTDFYNSTMASESLSSMSTIPNRFLSRHANYQNYSMTFPYTSSKRYQGQVKRFNQNFCDMDSSSSGVTSISSFCDYNLRTSHRFDAKCKQQINNNKKLKSASGHSLYNKVLVWINRNSSTKNENKLESRANPNDIVNNVSPKNIQPALYIPTNSALVVTNSKNFGSNFSYFI